MPPTVLYCTYSTVQVTARCPPKKDRGNFSAGQSDFLSLFSLPPSPTDLPFPPPTCVQNYSTLAYYGMLHGTVNLLLSRLHIVHTKLFSIFILLEIKKIPKLYFLLFHVKESSLPAFLFLFSFFHPCPSVRKNDPISSLCIAFRAECKNG